MLAFNLLGTTILSEPTLVYCQLEYKLQISVKFFTKLKHFYAGKYIWKYRLENGGHFVLASMC